MLQELTQPCKRVKACETQQLLEAVEATGKMGLAVRMRMCFARVLAPGPFCAEVGRPTG